MSGKQRKRVLHGLTAEGMVACNPRDREAAHRAENELLAAQRATRRSKGS